MALNKLRQLSPGSAGITLPKDELRIDGLIDNNGHIDGEHHFHVRRVEEGRYLLDLVDGLE